jgi:predicted Zn-dependent protease
VYKEAVDNAQADARKAIALAPDLGDGHLALAQVHEELLEYGLANEEYQRAITLAPGNAEVFRTYSDFAGGIGHLEAGIAAARRAALLDPLNPQSHAALAFALSAARRDSEAKAAFQDALALDPDYSRQDAWYFYYALMEYQDARTWCEKRADDWGSQQGLAIIYDKLGRHADAEAMLAKFKVTNPPENGWWYHYAEVYAQWGDTAKALSFLEQALTGRQDAFVYLKTDPLLDPLRKEPRFQAIERELKFPE